MPGAGSDNGPDRNNCNVGPGPTMDRKGLSTKGNIVIIAEGEYLLVPHPPSWEGLLLPCFTLPKDACFAPPKDACYAPPKDACF
ncbi:UNVERIFIED_CONTAM: hypothetical protein FKN15_071033 [Acipenser sinensis]